MTTFETFLAQMGNYEGKTVMEAKGVQKGRSTFRGLLAQSARFPLETVMSSHPRRPDSSIPDVQNGRFYALSRAQNVAYVRLNLPGLPKSGQKVPNEASKPPICRSESTYANKMRFDQHLRQFLAKSDQK